MGQSVGRARPMVMFQPAQSRREEARSTSATEVSSLNLMVPARHPQNLLLTKYTRTYSLPPELLFMRDLTG